VSETEIVQNDSIALRDKLQRNGAPVTLLQWAHTPHAFPVLARWLPEAKDAIANTSKFIRQHLKT
jgi:acetyl esterase/lipase